MSKDGEKVYNVPGYDNLLVSRAGKFYVKDKDTGYVKEIEISRDSYEVFARLVLITFTGYLPGAEIIYKDGDNRNIESSNLSYKIDLIPIDNDNMMICGDLFKKIPGYPNHFISKNGVVYGREYHKFLKYKICNAGYVHIGITNYSEKKPTRHFTKLHRLVYTTWGGNIPEGSHINHINSQAENNEYARTYGHLRKDHKHEPGLWTESEIRKICEYLSMGYTPIEIYDVMNLEGTISKLSFFARCADLKNHRDSWKNITKEYDFSNAYEDKREREYSQDVIDNVLRLIQTGVNYKDIANQLGVNFRAVGDIVNQYGNKVA